MTLAIWATKPADLKPLDRAGLVLFAGRCAMRFGAWAPLDARERFDAALARLVDAAFEPPLPGEQARALARPLGELGARACNALEATNAPLGRCQNYAVQALLAGLDVVAASARKEQTKHALLAAKLAASIPTVWAHAGRVNVRAPEGKTPVDVVAEATWTAIRADIERVARGVATIESAEERVHALRGLGPFWEGKIPSWTKPPQR